VVKKIVRLALPGSGSYEEQPTEAAPQREPELAFAA
jgi:hypothetical protein